MPAIPGMLFEEHNAGDGEYEHCNTGVETEHIDGL